MRPTRFEMICYDYAFQEGRPGRKKGKVKKGKIERGGNVQGGALFIPIPVRTRSFRKGEKRKERKEEGGGEDGGVCTTP